MATGDNPHPIAIGGSESVRVLGESICEALNAQGVIAGTGRSVNEGFVLTRQSDEIEANAEPVWLSNTARSKSQRISSIRDDCRKELERFKWIESEKAGYDLGELADRRWMCEHWNAYLKARWLEHLQGNRFWIEMDRRDFGLLERQFQDRQELLRPILKRLILGHENLQIIQWATVNRLPMDQVLEILETLDINSRHLAHRFDRI